MGIRVEVYVDDEMVEDQLERARQRDRRMISQSLPPNFFSDLVLSSLSLEEVREETLADKEETVDLVTDDQLEDSDSPDFKEIWRDNDEDEEAEVQEEKERRQRKEKQQEQARSAARPSDRPFDARSSISDGAKGGRTAGPRR